MFAGADTNHDEHGTDAGARDRERPVRGGGLQNALPGGGQCADSSGISLCALPACLQE